MWQSSIWIELKLLLAFSKYLLASSAGSLAVSSQSWRVAAAPLPSTQMKARVSQNASTLVTLLHLEVV